MSSKSHESLRTIQDSFTDPQIGILDKEQIPALQHLVKAAHDKLTVVPASQARRFDAFLATNDKTAFIQLTTLDGPDISSNSGLFIDIIGNLGNGMEHVAVIQTATTPDMVTAAIALELSNFKPRQLNFLAGLIEQTESIGSSAFIQALGPKFTARAADAEIDTGSAI